MLSEAVDVDLVAPAAPEPVKLGTRPEWLLPLVDAEGVAFVQAEIGRDAETVHGVARWSSHSKLFISRWSPLLAAFR